MDIPTATLRVRKEVNDLSADERKLLAKAFQGIMALPSNNPRSYFAMAAWHGMGVNACRHHQQPFSTWHRQYILIFENALRSIPGCENVTLPFWEATSDPPKPLPSWCWKAPFHNYDVTSSIADPNQRNDVLQFLNQAGYGHVTVRAVRNSSELTEALIDNGIAEQTVVAMAANTWADFSNNIQLEQTYFHGLESPHDYIHSSVGEWMGDPTTAAFDPIFWFHHSNIERLFRQWQVRLDVLTVPTFTAIAGTYIPPAGPPVTYVIPWNEPFPQREGGPSIGTFAWAVDSFKGTMAQNVWDPTISYPGEGRRLEAARFFVAGPPAPPKPPKEEWVVTVDRSKIRGPFTVRIKSKNTPKTTINVPFFQKGPGCDSCGESPLFSQVVRLNPDFAKHKDLSVTLFQGKKKLEGVNSTIAPVPWFATNFSTVVNPFPIINDIPMLIGTLKIAAQLELQLIPPYLSAAFSVPSTNEIRKLIKNIAVEEMGHLGCALNLLVALDSSKVDLQADKIHYPTNLPGGCHPDVILDVQPFSKKLIKTFSDIEVPDQYLDPSRKELMSDHTIGQFYARIRQAFSTLKPQLNQTRQISMGKNRGKFAVTKCQTIEDVETTIDRIVSQGEGSAELPFSKDVDDPSSPQGELAHFFTFSEIIQGRKIEPIGDSWGYTGAVITPPVAYQFDYPPPEKYSIPDWEKAANEFYQHWKNIIVAIEMSWSTGKDSFIGDAIETDMGPMFDNYFESHQMDGKCVGPRWHSTPDSIHHDPVPNISPLLDPFGASVLIQDGKPPGSVGRLDWLFPTIRPLGNVTDDYLNAVRDLGRHGGPIQRPQDVPGPIPQGLTYVGQFLDHNITFDSSSVLLSHGGPVPPSNVATNIVQARTGKVDLSHVYGSGPGGASFSIYDRKEIGKFFISSDFDVPRNGQQTALIPDPRNDNNIFILQLHLGWMLFHNKLVDEFSASGGAAAQDPLAVFKKAQLETQHHWQWIIMNEFLPAICDKNVLTSVLKGGRKIYTPKNWDEVFMPLEFSLGAYRLHPLVKENYQINATKSGTLFQLRQPFSSIDHSLKVDWNIFFSNPFRQPHFANRLEGLVVETFLNMPGPIDNPTPDNVPTDPALRSIAVRNMLRAASLGAASGQAVAQKVNRTVGGTPYPVYTNQTVFTNWNQLPREQQAAFTQFGTPIWYYFMREGQIANGGKTLGPIGSRIVAEVLTALIDLDETSYVHVPGWKPKASTMWQVLNYQVPARG